MITCTATPSLRRDPNPDEANPSTRRRLASSFSGDGLENTAAIPRITKIAPSMVSTTAPSSPLDESVPVASAIHRMMIANTTSSATAPATKASPAAMGRFALVTITALTTRTIGAAAAAPNA